jgi:serine/threonine-protein kinase RsbW
MAARKDLQLHNDLAEITRLSAELEHFCVAHSVSHDTLMAFNLALEELVTNTMSYGYGLGADGDIRVELAIADGHVEARLIDRARPYDPFQRVDPDVEAPLEERQIGGLGVMLVRKLMDHVAYEYTDGQNIVTIRKRADGAN